jgi:hypothetical protein
MSIARPGISSESKSRPSKKHFEETKREKKGYLKKKTEEGPQKHKKRRRLGKLPSGSESFPQENITPAQTQPKKHCRSNSTIIDESKFSSSNSNLDSNNSRSEIELREQDDKKLKEDNQTDISPMHFESESGLDYLIFIHDWYSKKVNEKFVVNLKIKYKLSLWEFATEFGEGKILQIRGRPIPKKRALVDIVEAFKDVDLRLKIKIEREPLLVFLQRKYPIIVLISSEFALLIKDIKSKLKDWEYKDFRLIHPIKGHKLCAVAIDESTTPSRIKLVIQIYNYWEQNLDKKSLGVFRLFDNKIGGLRFEWTIVTSRNAIAAPLQKIQSFFSENFEVKINFAKFKSRNLLDNSYELVWMFSGVLIKVFQAIDFLFEKVIKGENTTAQIVVPEQFNQSKEYKISIGNSVFNFRYRYCHMSSRQVGPEEW